MSGSAAPSRADPDIEYPVVTRQVVVGRTSWTITAVEDQDTLLDSVRTDRDVEQFPYGLVLWPSALGLAEYLAEHADLVRGGRVLELGAGTGLPGIVAAGLGARVVQTDYHEAALRLARHNATANAAAVPNAVVTLQADWRSFPPLEPFPVVIGSDILYERTLHAPLAALLPQVVASGGLLVIADPVRHQALEFMDLVEGQGWRFDMESRIVAWHDPPEGKEIAVFTARRPEQVSHGTSMWEGDTRA